MSITPVIEEPGLQNSNHTHLDRPPLRTLQLLPTGGCVSQSEPSKHDCTLSTTNVKPLKWLPNNGREADHTEWTNYPTFPPVFEPEFIFSTQPKETTQTKRHQIFCPRPNLPTTSFSNTPGQADSTQPDRVYLSNLSPLPTPILRHKRHSTNIHRGGTRKRDSNNRRGIPLQSDDASTTTRTTRDSQM